MSISRTGKISPELRMFAQLVAVPRPFIFLPNQLNAYGTSSRFRSRPSDLGAAKPPINSLQSFEIMPHGEPAASY